MPGPLREAQHGETHAEQGQTTQGPKAGQGFWLHRKVVIAYYAVCPTAPHLFLGITWHFWEPILTRISTKGLSPKSVSITPTLNIVASGAYEPTQANQSSYLGFFLTKLEQKTGRVISHLHNRMEDPELMRHYVSHVWKTWICRSKSKVNNRITSVAGGGRAENLGSTWIPHSLCSWSPAASQFTPQFSYQCILRFLCSNVPHLAEQMDIVSLRHWLDTYLKVVNMR